MSVLPIVDRELRVAARRAGTYWMRFWAALSVLALWLILLLNSNLSSPAQMGHHLLNALGILALIFSMLAGVFLTSDCLSEEKREGTLGLLFLTDLRAYDVVLGKLAAHSLHAFFGLLAIVPVLGLALLIGGVTGQEFSRLALVFVTTLFFSLGMGMVVSAVNSEAKHAIAGSFLLIMLFAGVLPALWWFQQMLLRIGALDVLLLPSPVFAYIKGFDAEYHSTNGARAFWSSVGTLFGLGLGGIVLANLVLPRSWPERSRKRSTMPPFPSLRGYSPKAAFKGWPVFHLDEPIYWLAVRDVSPRLAARKALLFLLPIWLFALVLSLATSHSREGFLTALFTAYAMHFVLKVLIAVEATRRMNQDRRSGAWELLLVTPLKVKSILAGQKRALLQHFRGAIIALSLVNATMMAVVLIFHQRLQMNHLDQMMFGQMFPGGVFALLLDFYALGWVGMWRGLKTQQHHRAVLATLAQIMSLPLLFFFLLLFLEPRVGNDSGPMIIMALWFATGFVVDALSAFRARVDLTLRFRAMVLQQE